MSRGISFVITKIERQCFKREPSNVEAKCTAVTCVLMIIMLLCGAWLQLYAEEWTFLVGFYFWFITFTTIGYGDYIPDKTSGSGGRIAMQLVWTTLGLCVVSSVLNALVAFLEKRQHYRTCSCRIRRNREPEDKYENEENEMNENNRNGNEMDGKETSQVDCNGTRKSEEKSQYNSVTYV